MARLSRLPLIVTALTASLLIAACGGGFGRHLTTNEPPSVFASEPNAPQASGNTATDAFIWFNFRRQQMGLPAVVRNANIDVAALAHSDYQKTNNVIQHTEDSLKSGFTGADVEARLIAAGYSFAQGGGYGEVISRTSYSLGGNAAEELIGAIYHRFVIFEPTFKDAGSGAATVSGGSTYLTVDFAFNTAISGLAHDAFVVYPFDGQPRVPIDTFSNQEDPDPVPSLDEVGYPISVHANSNINVTVQTFTVQPHGGDVLATRLLTRDNDAATPISAAAIIPLTVLTHATTYDVKFVGTVDGVAVNKSWSFTTKS